MNVRFYIERRKDEEGKLLVKERPVFMSASFRGKRVMIGTGVKVDIHGWDPERQRIRETIPDAHVLNQWLDTHVQTAGLAWKALSHLPADPRPEQFRNMFLQLRPAFSGGFFDVFYLFMESGLSRWTASTYRKVRNLYMHLRNMESISGIPVSFHEMNESFLERFTGFYTKKGYSSTTTLKAVNNLVWFLNWATDNGYNIHREYRRFYRKLEPFRAAPRHLIFLQWEEVMSIRNFRSPDRKLIRARDLFCFMCFTGIRYSELCRLKKEDVGPEEIMLKGKAGKLRKLPLNNHARKLWGVYENKYYLDNKAFPVMSIIALNKHLREIGKQAGQDRKVGPAVADDPDVPLYERLTAGVAVSTFIARALQLGVLPEVISRFTGVQHDSRLERIRAEMSREAMDKF